MLVAWGQCPNWKSGFLLPLQERDVKALGGGHRACWSPVSGSSLVPLRGLVPHRLKSPPLASPAGQRVLAVVGVREVWTRGPCFEQRSSWVLGLGVAMSLVVLGCPALVGTEAHRPLSEWLL